MLKKAIAGHYGLIPKLENLARENSIEAYNFPEGVITHLYRNIAASKHGTLSRIGLETFVDPRLEGAKVNEAAKEDLVELPALNGEETLYFSGPPINIALMRGATADAEGSISLERESLSLEILSLAMRATFGCLASWLTASFSPSPSFICRITANTTTRLFPAKSACHWNHCCHYRWMRRKLSCGAPRAAMELTPQAIVNLGVGLASGVGNIANEQKIADQIMLTIDPGIYGGVPLAGDGIGASLNYIASIDHPTQFDSIDGGGIDIAYFGVAECDGAGNVNASRFAGLVTGYGRFISISQKSKKVAFVWTFTSGGLETTHCRRQAQNRERR